MIIKTSAILLAIVASAQFAGFADVTPHDVAPFTINMSPNMALQWLQLSLRSATRAKTKEVITSKYQQIYNIPDHLIIKDGYVSDSSMMDGPIGYGFTASTLNVGDYMFAFEHRNRVGFIFETRKIKLSITDDKGSRDAVPHRIVISPVDPEWSKYEQGMTRADLRDNIFVGWSYHNSRGTPGGWELAKVEFIDNPPSKPQKATP